MVCFHCNGILTKFSIHNNAQPLDILWIETIWAKGTDRSLMYSIHKMSNSSFSVTTISSRKDIFTCYFSKSINVEVKANPGVSCMLLFPLVVNRSLCRARWGRLYLEASFCKTSVWGPHRLVITCWLTYMQLWSGSSMSCGNWIKQ